MRRPRLGSFPERWSTSTTVVPGTTTTTIPSPVCTDLGVACGQCGNGICMPPIVGI
jgi:hypothetical protein